MRENRTYGSEGGAAVKTVVPTPIATLPRSFLLCDSQTRLHLFQRNPFGFRNQAFHPGELQDHHEREEAEQLAGLEVLHGDRDGQRFRIAPPVSRFN